MIGYICNKIIKFAKENNADIVVIEDFEGLNERLGELRRMRKELGNLHNQVSSEGIHALRRKENNRKLLQL